ncbi:MAG TPA: NRDE family protein [Desulfuromonadales bacterium]|nr:NRDE family protein [Desulfuromonadales bacterium]
MCLILIAHRVHPDWPLVVLGNRDEFYDRPTSQLAPWPEAAEVLAGRDLLAGGTWMGARRDGRWAAVTNYREPDPAGHATRSRGWLVRDYLLGDRSIPEFLQGLDSRQEEYAGFNLLLGDRRSIWHCSNRAPDLQQLEPGLYGLSNGRFDAPWPKVCKGKQKLAGLLAARDWTIEDAFTLMADRERAPHQELPETGVPAEWEHALSAMFILAPRYGTRSTSLLTLDDQGRRLFAERHYTQPPDIWKDARYRW